MKKLLFGGLALILGVSAVGSLDSADQPATTIESSVSLPLNVAPQVEKTKSASNCHPSYSGCLKMNAGDYDCVSGSGNGPNYTGVVQVHGPDPFDLDRDNDGMGCE